MSSRDDLYSHELQGDSPNKDTTMSSRVDVDEGEVDNDEGWLEKVAWMIGGICR
jgi:hypothetical protein